MTTLWSRLNAAMRRGLDGHMTLATSIETPIWRGPLRTASFPLEMAEAEDHYSPVLPTIVQNAGVCVRGIAAVQLFARWAFPYHPTPDEEADQLFPRLFIFGRVAGEWALLTQTDVPYWSSATQPMLFQLPVLADAADTEQADLSKEIPARAFERIAVGIYPPHWAQSGALEAFVAPHNDEAP